MIVVEDKLKEIFDFLPAQKYEVGSEYSFKPVFGYGDQKELNRFLADAEADENHPYPLVWLLYPYEEIHKKKEVHLENLVLILATNTNNSMSNQERIVTNFKKVLIPLYDNVFTVLQRAINVSLVEETKITKYPNYSDDENDREQTFTIDRWDALRTTWEFGINKACLKHIKI